jgi:cytochrome oxidase assembly protein ShyY1
LQPVESKVIAGRNARGESGYSHLVDCRTGAEGPGMRVDIGWSKDPKAGVPWRGGPVSGIIAPDNELRMRLISGQGLGGLETSAPPDIADVPNNHRSYAVQWFLFAATALVIYVLAVRSRLGKSGE